MGRRKIINMNLVRFLSFSGPLSFFKKHVKKVINKKIDKLKCVKIKVGNVGGEISEN